MNLIKYGVGLNDMERLIKNVLKWKLLVPPDRWIKVMSNLFTKTFPQDYLSLRHHRFGVKHIKQPLMPKATQLTSE